MHTSQAAYAWRTGLRGWVQGMAASGKRLRELIAAPEILVLPWAWDGLSAILIEQAGFQGVLAGVREKD